MIEFLSLTVLVENSVRRPGLKAEHGLSWLLACGPRRVLFDTGQTGLFLENLEALAGAPADLDGIVLSHGHYDHTGGLAQACERWPEARVYHHPNATGPKYTPGADGAARFIGMPAASQRALGGAPNRVVLTPVTLEVVPGLFVTGTVPRRTDFEDVGGRFYRDEALQELDPLMDDQAVFFPTREGTVVILGCAHAGVVNTLMQIEQVTGESRFRAVLGGMHLLNASPERLAATVEALRAWEVPLLVPGHCTGWGATMRLWEDFRGRCAVLDVGARFRFDR